MQWVRYQGAAYWCLFGGLFLAMGIWESLRPRAVPVWRTGYRWGRHGMILTISIVARNVLLPFTAVGVALAASHNRFGLLNTPLLPFAVRFGFTLLLLDLGRYWIHRAFHAVLFLWRIHEVHHSDPDYDVSTAGRFHPLEVLLEQTVYLALIAVLAPPPVAVFSAELLALALNLFVHTNASLPAWLEAACGFAIVTPNLHRLHHSEEIDHQMHNFGQTFSVWDRCFGTFMDGAEQGAVAPLTGIKELRNEGSLRLRFMLAEPFRRRPSRQQTAVNLCDDVFSESANRPK